tara:strand:+ start:650 stop:835 length:186 start_codon:yes stop_codon:yes gene_type:complete
MDLEHGLIMFFMGGIITVIGFLIAFTIASRVVHKEEKRKKKIYSSVEESLRNLNAKFGDTE